MTQVIDLEIPLGDWDIDALKFELAKTPGFVSLDTARGEKQNDITGAPEPWGRVIVRFDDSAAYDKAALATLLKGPPPVLIRPAPVTLEDLELRIQKLETDLAALKEAKP